jgi:hypothetical protein
VPRVRVDPHDARDFDLDAGLLQDLAGDRLGHVLAEVHSPTGECPQIVVRLVNHQ